MTQDQPTHLLPHSEPVSTTLQRIIQDLLNESAWYTPRFAAPSDISYEDRIAAKALKDYADRLRKHPALHDMPSTQPFHLDPERDDWCEHDEIESQCTLPHAEEQA
jgi:hypothetical protein